MSGDARHPGFWRVFGLLLATARRRRISRFKRQRELRNNRAGKETLDLLGFFLLLGFLWMAFLQIICMTAVIGAAEAGHTIDLRQNGAIIVSKWFHDRVTGLDGKPADAATISEKIGDIGLREEANHNAKKNSAPGDQIEERIRQMLASGDTSKLVVDTPTKSLSTLGNPHSFSALFGSLVLLCWIAMMVFQGEGVDLDMQRSRNPMWEWLFSHPVNPAGVFFAELLAPIAANPIYLCAPLFIGFLYGHVFGTETGFFAAFIVGLPVAIAASCVGKSLEICAMLRLAPKSRGLAIGIMSWAGYATQILLFIYAFGSMGRSDLILENGEILRPLTAIPWPWLGSLLGARPDGTFSFLQGALTTSLAAIVLTAASIAFSVWTTNRGLSGAFARESIKPRARGEKPMLFGRDPLYRKEMLWFIRDRSAVIQTLLIPLTIAGIQIFNMRGMVAQAQHSWNYLCGAAILFGTYFLFVLGPRSLASEGAALWIPLTWPRGMESLLKAKAWLWTCISSVMVSAVFLYAVYLFPSDAWKIAIVAIGWFLFARSMAEKAVTLVRVTSSSGEQEKVPTGQRFVAQLGMLTFSIGVLTQQWNLAIVGVVFSVATSAAMWEAFRAKLPFLYDPWSEKLPTPPTLLHAMVAISLMVELTAVLTVIAIAFFGTANAAIAQTIAYGFSAVVVAMCFHNFLRRRGVSSSTLWTWPSGKSGAQGWWRSLGPGVVAGAVAGIALGGLALGYHAILEQIPFAAGILKEQREQAARIPDFLLWYGVGAVLVAPLAEEFLFRGALYRTLDREWGGWAAILGSAAFFAIFHHPLFWIPVGLVGVANAYLFKKTGHLAVPIALHMAYNAVVVAL